MPAEAVGEKGNLLRDRNSEHPASTSLRIAVCRTAHFRLRRDAAKAIGNQAKVLSDIGPRLRQAREQKNRTVRGFARDIGVSPTLISQIERGRGMPSLGTLRAIANELELVLDDL